MTPLAKAHHSHWLRLPRPVAIAAGLAFALACRVDPPAAVHLSEVHNSDASDSSRFPADATTTRSARPSPSETPTQPGTKGRIACGTGVFCNVGIEICCAGENRSGVSGPARCRPEGEFCRTSERWKCDDVTDCAAGELCCREEYGYGGALQACVATSSCPQNEACAEGSPCAGGLVCVNKQCGAAKVEVPCGKQTCSGERPVCCWSHERKQGECVERKEGPPQCPDSHGFQCSGPRDCGPGRRCCGFSLSSSCAGWCDSGNLREFCTSVGDCPERPEMSGAKARSCGRPANLELPPGMKVCIY